MTASKAQPKSNQQIKDAKPKKKPFIPLENADNIKYVIEDGILRIKCDLTKEHGLTSTKKSFKVGNSKGWKELDSDGKDTFKISFLLIRMK